MSLYAFDVETFPNFFCSTFVEIGTEEKFVFEIGPRYDQREDFLDFITQDDLELISFNGISYDTPILRSILNNFKSRDLNEKLFQISGRLIHDVSNDDEILTLRYRDIPWRQIDLMKMEALHRTGVGLKQAGINLKWPRIQDLPFEPDHIVTVDEIDTILDYNLNDVLITLELYEKLIDEVRLRKEVSALYKIDAASASRSKMANLILEKIYAQESDDDIRDIKEMRTQRSTVSVSDCLASNIHFQTKGLQGLLAVFRSTTLVRDNDFKFKHVLYFHNKRYDLGVGGLHSDDEAGKFVSSDEFTYRDADVASYYPSIMIQNKIKPDHLGDEFLKIMQQITSDRIKAKKNGNKTKADALKITINSIFGKLNSPVYFLQDAQAFMSVTINGQLLLLMLIESLTMAGIEVMSANTDGVLAKVPVSLEDEYQRICSEWQTSTGFMLEFTDYAQYIRADVNNYVAIKKDGHSKEKGRFVREIDIHGGYRPPIIAKALYNYFVDGTPVEDTLSTSRDIYDFCLSQKAGGQFKFELGGQTLQKNNRFFIGTHGQTLVKRNITTNKLTAVYSGEAVVLANDLREFTFDPTLIDFTYYLREVNKMIDEIDPPFTFMSMFE